MSKRKIFITDDDFDDIPNIPNIPNISPSITIYLKNIAGDIFEINYDRNRGEDSIKKKIADFIPEIDIDRIEIFRTEVEEKEIQDGEILFFIIKDCGVKFLSAHYEQYYNIMSETSRRRPTEHKCLVYKFELYNDQFSNIIYGDEDEKYTKEKQKILVVHNLAIDKYIVSIPDIRLGCHYVWSTLLESLVQKNEWKCDILTSRAIGEETNITFELKSSAIKEIKNIVEEYEIKNKIQGPFITKYGANHKPKYY